MCPTADHATAYIVDFAVWKDHSAFTGRTVRTVDCTASLNGGPACVDGQDAANACKNRSWSAFWSSGHGTAVASLLSGGLTGAARPEIVSVNIFTCRSDDSPQFTTGSKVTAALNWIKGDVLTRKAIRFGAE